MSSLYDVPQVYNFDANQLSKLESVLRLRRTDTTVTDVENSHDLFIREDRFCTRHGYRYTLSALRQLIKHLSGDHFSFIADINAPRDRDRKAASPVAAMRVINELIALRHDIAERLYVVRDERHMSIEAFIKQDTDLHDGAVVYERLKTMIREHGWTCKFVGARLIGRMYTYWFCEPDDAVDVVAGQSSFVLRGGFVCSREYHGGLRVWRCLFIPAGCIQPAGSQYGAVLPTSARDAVNRQCSLFASVVSTPVPIRTVAEAIQNSANRRLIDMLPTQDMDGVQWLCDKLATMLLRDKVPYSTAMASVRRAFYKDVDIEECVDESEIFAAISRGTRFSIVCALAGYAKKVSLRARDRLELGAFKYLMSME